MSGRQTRLSATTGMSRAVFSWYLGEVGHELGLRRVEALALLALEFGDAHVEGLGADLDVRSWRCDQVEVPVRMGVGAALGREHQVPVTVGVERERVEELLAAASAVRVEQQDRGAGHSADELRRRWQWNSSTICLFHALNSSPFMASPSIDVLPVNCG